MMKVGDIVRIQYHFYYKGLLPLGVIVFVPFTFYIFSNNSATISDVSIVSACNIPQNEVATLPISKPLYKVYNFRTQKVETYHKNKLKVIC